MTFKKFLFNFKIIFLIFLIQILLVKKSYSVPNAGSLLNFEEEIRKVNILPTQVPENKDLINGVNEQYNWYNFGNIVWDNVNDDCFL